MPNFCAALHCSRMSSHSVLAFFRFPRDPDRCKKWVENCSRSDLRDKTPEHLNKYHRLCARHFEPELILKTSPFRTVLKDTAIPTIFDNPICKRKKAQEEETLPQAKVQRVEENQDEHLEKATESANGQEAPEEPQVVDADQDQREYLHSLFDVVVMMGRQNFPLQGHTDKEPRSEAFTPSNFQALLEFRINAGDAALRRRFEASATSAPLCLSTQLQQILEVFEKCVYKELLAEVKEARFFSLVMENIVEIAGESRIPTFIRFVDQNNCLREEFLGFLLFEGDEEKIVANFCAEISEKNGLSMEDCRGQTYFSTGVHATKIKAIAAKLCERFPLAVLTPSSCHALNISLANSLNFTSVHLVMSTLKKVSAFFSRSPLLLDQLENAISIYYQDNEEKANALKQVCRTDWTQQHDTFEVGIDLLESLLLCMDSVHDNEELKWSDETAHEGFVISEALADFEFVMALVVLKNILSFSRAFGKNLQGQTIEVFLAAHSLTAVLHSLKEVCDNIEVYHEFWFEEAVNLAAALEIPVKIPRLFFRKQRPDAGEEIQPETYYKIHLTIPVVTQVIKDLSDFFSENHLNALRSLSFVPAIMSQLKFNTEEDSADVYKNDLPIPETLPTELNCWKIKWKHGTKNVTLPSTIYETLQLSDVKFFPNVCALLKILHCLPVLSLTEEKNGESRRRLTAYLQDTPPPHRHKSLALLHVNCTLKVDVDSMVEMYLKTYPDKEATEEPV